MMICKELKQFSENIFGFRKRHSIAGKCMSSADNADLVPLAETMYYEQHMHHSSVDSVVQPFPSQPRAVQTPQPAQTTPATSPQTPVSAKETTPTDTVSTSRTSRNSPINLRSGRKKSESIGPLPDFDAPVPIRGASSTPEKKRQGDLSFTWYDFDGKSKVTKKDISIVMRSVYDVVRQQSQRSRLHLLLQWPPPPSPAKTGRTCDGAGRCTSQKLDQVSGLDLASSDEQIYQASSVLTTLTEVLHYVSSSSSSSSSLSSASSSSASTLKTRQEQQQQEQQQEDPPERDQQQPLTFMERCFRQLHDRNQDRDSSSGAKKRSKSTPTEHHTSVIDGKVGSAAMVTMSRRPLTRQHRHHRGNSDCAASVSTSLLSLAGSCEDDPSNSRHFHSNNHRQQRPWRREHNHRHRKTSSRRIPKRAQDQDHLVKRDQHQHQRHHCHRQTNLVHEPYRTYSNSCHNIIRNNDFYGCLIDTVPSTPRHREARQHSKPRSRQHIRKYLGRKQVEEWLKHDISVATSPADLHPGGSKRPSDGVAAPVQILHHHYHHHNGLAARMTHIGDSVRSGLSDNNVGHSQEIGPGAGGKGSHRQQQQHHHHFHVHHHHHHYFF